MISLYVEILTVDVDFIEGADDIPMRDVIDYKVCSQGIHMLDFLISSECCILNGRNNSKNDYTSFNHNGQAVVDYVILAHEMLHKC